MSRSTCLSTNELPSTSHANISTDPILGNDPGVFAMHPGGSGGTLVCLLSAANVMIPPGRQPTLHSQCIYGNETLLVFHNTDPLYLLTPSPLTFCVVHISSEDRAGDSYFYDFGGASRTIVPKVQSTWKESVSVLKTTPTVVLTSWMCLTVTVL